MIDLSRNHTSTIVTRLADVCIWHNKQKQRPLGADRQWAKARLDQAERGGDISPAEANEIRQLCNWDQPSLFPSTQRN